MHVETPADALPPAPETPPPPPPAPEAVTETTVLATIPVQYATGPVLWAVVPRQNAGDDIGWNLLHDVPRTGALRGIVRGMLEHALRELDRADAAAGLDLAMRRP